MQGLFGQTFENFDRRLKVVDDCCVYILHSELFFVVQPNESIFVRRTAHKHTQYIHVIYCRKFIFRRIRHFRTSQQSPYCAQCTHNASKISMEYKNAWYMIFFHLLRFCCRHCCRLERDLLYIFTFFFYFIVNRVFKIFNIVLVQVCDVCAYWSACINVRCRCTFCFATIHHHPSNTIFSMCDVIVLFLFLNWIDNSLSMCVCPVLHWAGSSAHPHQYTRIITLLYISTVQKAPQTTQNTHKTAHFPINR